MTVALVLSGGTGSRMEAGIPKQYMEVGGRPVISYCIERMSRHGRVDAIQIVAAGQWHDMISKCIEKYGNGGKFKGFSEPGENRQLSVYNGLKDIMEYADSSDIVLVHDAARPLLSESMINDCIDAMEGHDGVLPVLPMKDTVYRSADGKKIDALENRGEIYAGQAPEAFRIGPYYDANNRLLPDMICRINGSTEPAVMAGMDVAMIQGDEENFKITTHEDLERFTQAIKRKVMEDGSMGFARYK